MGIPCYITIGHVIMPVFGPCKAMRMARALSKMGKKRVVAWTCYNESLGTWVNGEMEK